MTAPPATLRTIVGQRIRDVRRRRGLSAAGLARELGWPTETLINFEYGRRPLYLDRLEVIAHALHVSPLALLVADETTADTIAQLADDADLAGEVRFFLDALDAEPPVPGTHDD